MSNVVQMRSPRTIAHILADILMETAAIERAEMDWYRTRSDEASNRAAKHDTVRFQLRKEAELLVEQQTGVTWDALRSVLS